jgi:RHS repeat-associated protein
MQSGMDANALVYGYNAEEYNPVTDMQYLRSRYYSPTSQSFTTEDTYTGNPYDIASANRYAYTEGNPVNNADPTGHMIGTSSYERQMEGAGGINEIYDFYVGVTLQNSLIRATNSFYGSLEHARATDYRSQAAINSISLISQATANLYINQGADAARSVGATYGCTPGALTNQAISSFANDVNTTKNSVNTQISAVKSQKQYQHQQYELVLQYMSVFNSITNALKAIGQGNFALAARLLNTSSSDVLGKLNELLNGLGVGVSGIDGIMQMGKGVYDVLENADLAGEVPQLARGLSIAKGAGAALALVGSGVTFVGALANGESVGDAIADSTYGLVAGAAAFIPYAGPFISAGMTIGDIASQGAASKGTSDFMENEIYTGDWFMDFGQVAYSPPMNYMY